MEIVLTFNWRAAYEVRAEENRELVLGHQFPNLLRKVGLMLDTDPGVKMILQHPKWHIDVMAWERKISTHGRTKLELAKEIAEYESKRSQRYWKTISG